MINYYSFNSHEEYLTAVKEGAKVTLEVDGEASIISPKMAEEIAREWREEYDSGLCSSLYGVRPVPGKIHRYEAYKIL